MSTTIQTLTLRSDKHFGKRVPPKQFGELIRILPEAVRYSIRMAFESRSQANGKRPRWLTAASDIRFLDHSGDDETIVHFEVPRLGDAAKELYRQSELWTTRPEPTDTGFDLFGDVILDVASNNSDSDRFDRPLLRQIHRFKSCLNDTFQGIEFSSSRTTTKRPFVIDNSIVEAANRLSLHTPKSQQLRIVGTLDMIRSSTNSFAIKLRDKQEVRGALIEGKVADINSLLEHEVLILGKAVYRASGKLLRIDAQHVQLAGAQDEFFATLPRPRYSRFDSNQIVQEHRGKNGVSAIFGKWPSDETDEEIAAALKEID